MLKIKVKGQTVQTGELGQSHKREGRTDGRTGRRTNGRSQVHYLPRFAVDKNPEISRAFQC